MIPQKACTKCGETKPLDDFPRSSRNKNGRIELCRICNRERGKAYYQKNSAKVMARTIKYRKDHPDLARKVGATFRERHKEQLAEARATPERRKYHQTYSKKHYQANKPAYKARIHAYIAKRPEWKRERALIGGRRWRARKRNAQGNHTAIEWNALKAQYDHTCLCCGKREPEIALTADHVIPLVRGGSDWITNIQPLCLSCNSSKGRWRATDYRPLWPSRFAQLLLDW